MQGAQSRFASQVVSPVCLWPDEEIELYRPSMMCRIVDEIDTEIKGHKVHATWIDEYGFSAMDYLPEAVKIAKIVQELSFKAQYTTEWSAVAPVWIQEKNGYRRNEIKSATVLKPGHVRLGKRGLLFVLDPADKQEWEFCEFTWREVQDVLPQMWSDLCVRISALTELNAPDYSSWDEYFETLDKTMANVFKENPAMYKAATEGLVRAMEQRREWVEEALEVDQDHPAFGMF